MSMLPSVILKKFSEGEILIHFIDNSSIPNDTDKESNAWRLTSRVYHVSFSSS